MNKTRSLLCLVASLAIGLTGCTSVKQHGNIVSVTESTLGIDMSQGVNQAYRLRLGFNRTQYHVIPTDTNVIYAPNLSSSIDIDHHALSTHVAEAFGTGAAATKPDEQPVNLNPPVTNPVK